ncbi:MAG TPA: hypothetical protein VFH73_03025 [Polyangia bacterium]|nr:hypothetical protein [Polyangia bacterium]
MVFKVEAKTALDEANSWVRIAKGRLIALAAQDSDNPGALQGMACELAEMYEAINDIATRLAGVDDEWTQLFAPNSRPTARL